MSKPTNSAARNQMTKWERQCYDWGWEDAEERIIKLLKDEELRTHPNNLMKNYDELVWLGIKEQLIELIKGEQK